MKRRDGSLIKNDSLAILILDFGPKFRVFFGAFVRRERRRGNSSSKRRQEKNTSDQ